MDEREFRRLLHDGRGRAIQFARANDVSAFRETILDACLHCHAVDPDGEGTRSGYMLDLVRNQPDFEFYRRCVLDALARCSDDWNTVQRFWFAQSLAKAGDPEARRLLYAAFQPGPRHGEALGVVLLKLDGMPAFLHAAEKIGSLVLSGVENCDLGWLHSAAVEEFGEEETAEALSGAAASNAAVEAYRAATLDSRDRSGPDFKGLPWDQFRPLLGDATRWRVRQWGAKASDEDLLAAAHDLVSVSSDSERLVRVRIFSMREFPLDPAPLLALTQSEDRALAWEAAVALTNVVHPAARTAAIQWMESCSDLRSHSIDILDRNFEPGDHELALRWFENETDREMLHHLGRDVRHVWDHHPEAATEPAILLAVYERNPCSMCREFIVRDLIKLAALPEHVRLECADDASDETRELVESART